MISCTEFIPAYSELFTFLEDKHGRAEVDAFWVDTNKVPYEEMREADRNFLPDIISGQYVKRRFIYDENFHITEIINL